MIDVNIDFLIKYIEESYLPRARWWPHKGVLKKIELLDYVYSDKLLVLIFKSDIGLFQLPLLVTSKPREYLESRSFSYGDRCFIEAEYSIEYLREISSMSKIKYRPILAELRDIHVEKAEALTLESTNSIVIYHSNLGKLVYKSYRLLPEVNIEVKMLDRLTRMGYRYIPRIYGFVYYDEIPSGILMEYVEGEGDGGAPFYRSLVKYLSTREEDPGVVDLSTKLGVIIGELHIALNKDREDGFFGVEFVDDRDISTWINRLYRMYNHGLMRIDEVIGGLSRDERDEVEFWRDMYIKASWIIEEAVSYIDKYSLELYKARTHQDLHLAQMVYRGDGVVDFVIIDFEGEPGRTSDERLLKEPLIRDIASMIRSFHYLSHAALMDTYRLPRHETSLNMIKEDMTSPWRTRQVLAMTHSYSTRVTGSGLIGPREKEIARNIWLYLYPWVVERAVYEFYYESMYRPLWISIPITGLYESTRYKSIKM